MYANLLHCLLLPVHTKSAEAASICYRYLVRLNSILPVRLYGLLRLSNRHLLLCCKAEYRNLSFAVVAVSDEQHLSEDIASALFEYEQV